MARRISVQLVGDSKSLERAFDRAGKKGQQFDSTMSRTSSNLKAWGKAGAIGAAAGGVTLLTAQVVKSVGAAREAELAQTRLQGALASAGVSHRKYGKQIDAVIQKTSKLAALDDEELSDSYARLVRTTGSVTKATKGVALAADIARARNITLAAATNIVEKAHVGQLRGLKSVGVATEAGVTATEALERAQRKFAGSAERYGKTSVAANERLGVAWENVQEKLGKKLLPALVKASESLLRMIEWGERNWPRFSAAVERVWQRVRPVFDAFKQYLGGWIKIIQGIIEGDWSLVWKGVKQTVSAAFDLLFAYLKAVPARLFMWGVRMGKQLAAGVLAGIGNLAEKIGNKLLPGNPIGGGTPDAGPATRGGRRAAPRAAAPAPKGPELYAGPRAEGGPALANRTYKVGENGPEWLTMGNRSGNISPGGGGGIYIASLSLPGVTNVQQFLSELQRIGRTTSAQRRGHTAGTRLATS